MITLLPVQGQTFPSTGSDPNGAYYAWALNNAAQYSFTVPNDYQPGTDLVLLITEGTPGQSVDHQWSAVSSLNNGTPQTFTTEYTSPSSAGTLTVQSFVISTYGKISTIGIGPGSLFNVVVQRIAANSNEDPNSIKTYNIDLSYTAVASPFVYTGRLGTIETRIRSLFNETYPSNSPFITEDNILTWVNQCKNELALENYFTRWSTLDWPAIGFIDLRAMLPDMVTVFQDEGTCLRMDDTTYPNGRQMRWLADQGEWSYYYTNPGQWTPWPYHGICFLDRDLLNLLPSQAVTITGGINLKNSYEPIDLTGIAGTAGVTPPTPASYDMIYVYYALWNAFMKESRDASTMRANKAPDYQGLYEKERARLLRQKAPRITGVRPYI